MFEQPEEKMQFSEKVLRYEAWGILEDETLLDARWKGRWNDGINGCLRLCKEKSRIINDSLVTE